MKATPELLRKCEGYQHAVLIFVDADGYPVSVATDYRVDEQRRVLTLATPGGEVLPADGTEVNVIVSHIRPYPGMGYDQRRYVQVWGPVQRINGSLEVSAERFHTWNEQETPFVEYNEISVPQSKRYLRRLSTEQGREVRPRLAGLWLFLRATRLPFLTATVVPVLLGIAVAANDGSFHLGYAALTLLGASCIHLGLNVANDVFDTMSGADAANTTPTQFSGGSRVVHYGLMSLRSIALISAAFYAGGIAIGVYLAVERGFWLLFWIGFIGVVISVIYTAPPSRLVHRGIGEVAVGIGFGPIVVLGSYFVQAQRLTWEAVYASIPVAIFIALILYLNEIPDRAGDARAGKRTLPVRWSRERVIAVYTGAVWLAYAVIAIGAITGVIPRPTIIALATIPVFLKALKGVRAHYESPYELMPFLGTNIQLHLFTGLLLFAGYLVAIIAGNISADPPAFLR
jgi:1,4-dihydroxy-2-naphthoate octaprenyltransferase